MPATRERIETFEVFDHHLVRKVVPVRGEAYSVCIPRRGFRGVGSTGVSPVIERE